jgi:hypothetical protein
MAMCVKWVSAGIEVGLRLGVRIEDWLSGARWWQAF